MEQTNVENVSSEESQGGEKRKSEQQNDKKQPAKKKNKTSTSGVQKPSGSKVWAGFDKFTDDEGTKKARCKHCSKALAGDSSKNGTSTLRRHLKICSKHPNRLKAQTNIFVQKNDDVDGGSTIKTWKFCQERCRRALAEMIILDELPFSSVDHKGFRKFMETICPNFKIPSRFTIARDCANIYLKEKAKLKSFFTTSRVRVCLTTNTWTSLQRISYMCVTAHFIDDDWVYHKRIISFKPIYSHTGEELSRVLLKSLKEWDIEHVLTITTDNASSNDTAISILKTRLGNLFSDGRYLHVRCVAHIINLIVKDGLGGRSKSSVERIRNAGRYIRYSPKRLDAFKKCAKDVGIDSKTIVSLDCPTRWSSAYEMLDTAAKFEKAFEEYDLTHRNYRNDLGVNGVPTMSDWHYARQLANVLELFKRKTIRASASTHVCLLNLVFILNLTCM